MLQTNSQGENQRKMLTLTQIFFLAGFLIEKDSEFQELRLS